MSVASRSVPTTTPRSRVVVLALSYRPQKRVLHYVAELAAAGVDVDLVLAETRSTENLSLDPPVRVSTIFRAELRDVAVRRYERALVLQRSEERRVGKECRSRW